MSWWPPGPRSDWGKVRTAISPLTLPSPVHHSPAYPPMTRTDCDGHLYHHFLQAEGSPFRLSGWTAAFLALDEPQETRPLAASLPCVNPVARSLTLSSCCSVCPPRRPAGWASPGVPPPPSRCLESSAFTPVLPVTNLSKLCSRKQLFKSCPRLCSSTL